MTVLHSLRHDGDVTCHCVTSGKARVSEESGPRLSRLDPVQGNLVDESSRTSLSAQHREITTCFLKVRKVEPS